MSEKHTNTGALDRSHLTREEFHDLLTFEGTPRVGTNDLVIRDSNEVLVYAVRRKDTESQWYVREFCVQGGEISFTVSDTDRANIAAVLVEQFDAAELTTDERNITRPVQYGVPTVIAIDGRPAICAWLYVVQELSREAIAARMDVGESTVTEYLSRFRQRGTGIPDSVDLPDVGTYVPTIPLEFDITVNQSDADRDGGSQPTIADSRGDDRD